MFDTVIQGGTIIDGTGGPAYLGDVAIVADRIVQIGVVADVDARNRIDATGFLVTPGFVDIHSHSDFTLLVDGRAESSIRQGVTSEIVGNCGHGCAPIHELSVVAGNIYGYTEALRVNWTTMGEYLERLQSALPAVNVATLVPNGNLRLAAVRDTTRPATPDEIQAMVELLENALDAGALGFSSGLEYPAESAASADELTTLSRTASARGGYYATHTRNRDVHALAAIQEGIDVARRAEVRLQISHIIPRRGGPDDSWKRALELVDRAWVEGLDVAFDSHTRLHGFTNLSTALPADVLAQPTSELKRRLESPSDRAALRDYSSIISSFGLGGWDRVRIFSCPTRPELVGRTVQDLAGGADPFDVIFDILLAEVENIHVPMCLCHSYDEEWLRSTISHPLCTVGSDATALCTDGPLAGSAFPGAYTWAAWFFRRMVRETGDLSWEDGIRKLTLQPAERVGLRDRGRIAEGWFADLTVLDPESTREVGTLHEPSLPAEGIVHVFVNGCPVLEAGTPTGHRPGRVLRRGT